MSKLIFRTGRIYIGPFMWPQLNSPTVRMLNKISSYLWTRNELKKYIYDKYFSKFESSKSKYFPLNDIS